MAYGREFAELKWLQDHPEFSMRPATIREFIGPGYLDDDKVRPGVLSGLVEVFGEEVSGDMLSKVRRAVFTGAIGTGKTTFASIALVYMLHWVKCLKDPQEYYGLMKGTVISLMMMSTSMKLAQEVTFGAVKARINNSVWFKQYSPVINDKMTTQMRFPGDIWIVPGTSEETSFEGHNILAGIIDEGDCVDVETQILTSTGWKYYDTLNVGDLILTLNHDTGFSEWQPVDDVKIYDGPRKMVHMEGERFSSMTTHNHRWPVERPRKNGDERVWTTTRDMGFHDKIIRSAQPSDLPTTAKYSDSMVELVAWFYTEGCDPYKNGKTAYITQSPTKNPKNCERIRSALTREFGKAVEAFPRQGRSHDGLPRWREKHRARGEYWGESVDFVLSVSAGAAVQELCPGKIPSVEFLMALTQSQLELFIKVSMLADNNGKRRFAQKDRGMAESFAFACILLGYPVTIRQASTGLWVVYSPKTNTVVPVRNSRKSGGSRIKITEVDYDDVIWCPTVANHSWLARRNGVTYFTGNSHKITGKKDYAESAYDTINSRIASRYPDFYAGDHRGLMIVIGQMKSKSGFMSRKYLEFAEDTSAVSMRMSLWESYGWHMYTKDKGDIERGIETSERDSFYFDQRRKKLLSKEAAQMIMNKDLIEVPKVYEKQFANDPVKALRDLAGIPPEADDPFISQTDRIIDCQEAWKDAYGESPIGVEFTLDDIILPELFKPHDDFKRVIHIDTAFSAVGDALGFAMGHVPYKRTIFDEERPVIVFDMLMRLKARSGTQIDFGQLREFIYGLTERGFEISMISMDGFNTTDMIQQLKRKKYKVQYVSVDKTKGPYEDLREAINDRRCLHPALMSLQSITDTKAINIAYKELSELSDTGRKIDHPPLGSKDIADAMAGVVFELMNNKKYQRAARTQEDDTKTKDMIAEAYAPDTLEQFLQPGDPSMSPVVTFEEFARDQAKYMSEGVPGVNFDFMQDGPAAYNPFGTERTL